MFTNSQVHGEVTDPEIDIFDRERVFIDTVLKPLIQKFPRLKVVMEHVTTMDAIKFVESCDEGIILFSCFAHSYFMFNMKLFFRSCRSYCHPTTSSSQ